MEDLKNSTTLGLNTLKEGGSEAATKVTTLLFDNLTLDRDIDWGKEVYNIVDEGIVGGIMGSGTTLAGSIANTDSCRCGNEECTASRGLICYSTNGGGSCRKNDVGPFGYPRPNSGNCDDVAGRKSILDKETCEAAATSLGLSDVEAYERSSSSYPPGCYWRGTS